MTDHTTPPRAPSLRPRPVPGDRRHPPSATALALAGWAALGLAGCSSDSSTSSVGAVGSGGMSILSCSLGCTQVGGAGVGCSVSQVFVNQDIWVEFSQPVALSTVNKNTFQVTNALTGETPAGTYLADPNNPRRVAFRPLLSFDSSGNPIFGLAQGNAYRISIPAGSGQKIQSQSGAPNQAALECFVQATLGVNDAVPGAPSLTAFLDSTGGGATTSQLANGAEDVPLSVRVRLEFDDLMNPASLVNPATGTSETLRVAVDLDGELATTADRLPLSGSFQILLDNSLNRTTVFFEADGGFPSSGADTNNPRRMVVEVPPLIADIAGVPLANPGEVVFTTLSVPLAPTDLPYGSGEDFTSLDLLDLTRSGAVFETEALPGGGTLGRARPGLGGGSGRFGDLVVRGGETYVLGTGPIGSSYGPTVATNPALGNAQTYVVDNYDPALLELPGTENLTAQNAVYEFSSLEVQAGAVLRFSGGASPRIFVRGDLRMDGIVQLTGSTPVDHPSSEGFGSPGGAGGPGAGAGGRGGDRANTTGTPIQPIGGFAHGVGVAVQLDGTAGQGRGGLPNAGGGEGGSRWPLVYPGPLLTDLGGFLPTFQITCESRQLGAPGGGGSYGSLGGEGQWANTSALPPSLPPPPPAAQGGASTVRAADTSLDPDAGLLIGGAGGGGGGGGIGTTRLLALPNMCSVGIAGQPLQFQLYVDHSGAGGGGGGGAMQIQVGRRAAIGGTVDLTGGRGGRSVPVLGFALSPIQAAPGGGGSGGALLLQAQQLGLAQIEGVIDVRGGEGGLTQYSSSRGGQGGGGIVRMERPVGGPETTASEVAKVLPLTGGPGQPALGDVVFVGDWTPKNTGASARSGLQSCWLIPDGAVFDVEFDEDDLSDPLQPVFGWNMELELSGGIVSNYRGPSPSQAILGVDLETFWGGDLGTAPVVVRFQGARVVGGLEQPCQDGSLDPNSKFLPGSLTPWVRHPAELNGYWDLVLPADPGLAAQRKPNVIRYQVIFDREAVDGTTIQGVRSFRIGVQPD